MEQQILQQILEKIENMDYKLNALADVDGKLEALTKDQAVLKSTVLTVDGKLEALAKEQNALKSTVLKVETSINHGIDKAIKTIAEGHLDLNHKLDIALDLENRVSDLEDRMTPVEDYIQSL